MPPVKLDIKVVDGVPVLNQIGQYREGIASIESAGSGGYSAIGPRTKSGDRAYGRYQVMGRNIPAWTKQVLGRQMTPEQFLADPQAQDAVFDQIFGGYVQKYGNPQDAASMWFSGKPLSQAGGRRDILGTTPEQYVNKFNQASGGGVNPSQQFTQQPAFGLPVQQVGDVVRGPWGGVNEILGPEMGGRRAYSGGANSGFGSRWRSPEGVKAYEAEAGLRPGTLEPVSPRQADLRKLSIERGLREVETTAAPKAGRVINGQPGPLPDRIARFVRDNPQNKKVIREWMHAVDMAGPGKAKMIKRLSAFLMEMGY